MKRILFSLLLLALAVPAAQAGIIAVGTGTAAPPASIGGIPWTLWADDGLPGGYTVTPIVGGGPGGLTLGVAPPAGKAYVGIDWATWSHGYAGAIYYSMGSTSMGLALSAPVDAFLFYAEPNPFGLFDITATAQDGTVLTQTVDGASGATGFGFYGTGGSKIVSVMVTSSVDFAVGEFATGNKVPEPTSLLLLGLGVAGVAIWRRKK
jgi:hypothetical protein